MKKIVIISPHLAEAEQVARDLLARRDYVMQSRSRNAIFAREYMGPERVIIAICGPSSAASHLNGAGDIEVVFPDNYLSWKLPPGVLTNAWQAARIAAHRGPTGRITFA